MRASNGSTWGIAVVLVLTSLGLAACGGATPDEKASEPASSTAGGASAPGSSMSVAFDSSDLDAYARGIRREIEAVKAAKQRSATAKTPAERGEAFQATFDTATIPLGAEAAGLPTERYRAIRESVHEVFQTLDFQEKIDGPLSMDMSRASASTKVRLARDAFADLPEASATALRARMNELVPVWIEYVTLTAVAG